MSPRRRLRANPAPPRIFRWTAANPRILWPLADTDPKALRDSARMTAIARSVLDTASLSPEEGFRTWRDEVSAIFDVRADPSGFGRARMEAAIMGDWLLGHSLLPGQAFDRTRSKIARDGLDVYLIQFYLGGATGDRDAASGEWTRPGDMYIVDASESLSTDATASEIVHLVLPRPMLSPLLHSPDGQGGRIIRGDAPLVALLRQHLVGLNREVGRMSQAEASLVLKPTLELAAAAINGAPDPMQKSSVEHALIGSIRRHVSDNLADPSLSAESIMGAFGISRTTLYRLFDCFGGIASYVRDERLKRCRDMLADPACSHLTAAEIGARWGFMHPESFTRAFTKAFGIGPRAVRQAAAERMRPGQGRDPAWSRWLTTVR